MSSYTYTITRDDIISRALRLIGVVAQGETPTADQITEGSVALNGLVLSWQSDGLPLWVVKKAAITPVVGQSVYTLGAGQSAPYDVPKPLKVIQAWYHNTSTNIDVPIRIVTEYDYNKLGNKTVQGLPIQIWYQPLSSTGNLTVYQVPDAWTASNVTIYIVYHAPFSTFDISTDTLDFPQEWYDAVTYGLATRLAPEYGVPLGDRKTLWQEMSIIKQEALNFGLEEGSMYFQVNRQDW